MGQSTNIKRRVGQHKEAILDVKHNKNSNQRLLYHKLAQYPMKKLRFVKLYAIPKQEWRKLDRHQKFELLTFFEQLAMDVYKPKFNKIAARMTEA